MSQNTYRVSLTMTLDSGDAEGAAVTFMELLESWMDNNEFSGDDLEVVQVDAEAQYA